MGIKNTIHFSLIKIFFPTLHLRGAEKGITPFPGLFHFTLDLYLIMLSFIKQDGIKYHFLSLWFDSTWD